MTSKQLSVLWGEALTETDRDAYVSDWSNSTLLVPPEAEEIPAGLPEELGRIWDAAHRTVAEIRATTGLTQPAFAVRFCLPVRTVQNWEYRDGSCADYVRLLIQQQLGLVSVPED